MHPNLRGRIVRTSGQQQANPRTKCAVDFRFRPPTLEHWHQPLLRTIGVGAIGSRRIYPQLILTFVKRMKISRLVVPSHKPIRPVRRTWHAPF